MKCNYCKTEMKYREFLADMDSENLKRLDYYYCEGCGIIYNIHGDPVAELADVGEDKLLRWVSQVR